MMKKSYGNIWVNEFPIVTNKYYFTYKYAILDQDGKGVESWERGIDRIADLELLPNNGNL
jgi:hypothetical protein